MNIKKTTAIALAGLISVPVWAFTPASLTDFDGDGVISAAEIKQTRKAQMITEFDTDGDGELSRVERRAAKKAMRAARIAAFDSDGDGALSDSEKTAAREARMATIESQLDTNGDGVVSDAERAGFDQVMSERKERVRGKKKGERKSQS